MSSSLNLGRYAGIAVKIHWTFSFLLIFVVVAELSRGASLNEVLFTLGFVLAIFLCVVLHEYGHALTARRYGINTDQIVLLPIGGIANIQKMPKKPKQELVIAIAGPLVNVVIAAILALFLPLEELTGREEAVMTEAPTAENFFLLLFSINIILVLFNAIPAFPMDGGRVLRALLAMAMPRLKATKVAARIGQLFSLLFIVAGFFYNPWLVLIGIFVFFAANSEYKLVKEGKD
jgi:Zn-dependent protease